MNTLKKISTVMMGLFIVVIMSICSNTPDEIPDENGPVEGNQLTPEIPPAGMTLVWSDEFDGNTLNKNNWFTDYYSTFDFAEKSNYAKFMAGKLPQPGILFTGNSMVLVVDNKIPTEAFWGGGRKVSSIQTYDWRTNKLLFDNSLGGFIEARIKRSRTPDAEKENATWNEKVNGAFWLDSPGPDLRYFVEKGDYAYDVSGIRPHGQVFEIDLCELLTTEIVLHDHISITPEGKYERQNMGHYSLLGESECRNKWVTHSMLWSPAGLKFYIDGQLKINLWNPHDIKSPNHAMNILLGLYGNSFGTATMEVDYIRFYQWKLDGKNELPNPGFEYHDALFPWEGKGTVASSAARTGKYGVELAAGESITQLVFLDHSHSYSMKFWVKGNGKADAGVENITQVTGSAEDRTGSVFNAGNEFTQHEILFSTNPEPENHKRTVKVTFKNTGSSAVAIDDITIEKVN